MRTNTVLNYIEKKVRRENQSRVMQNRAQAMTLLSFMSDKISGPLRLYMHNAELQHIEVRVGR